MDNQEFLSEFLSFHHDETQTELSSTIHVHSPSKKKPSVKLAINCSNKNISRSSLVSHQVPRQLKRKKCDGPYEESNDEMSEISSTDDEVQIENKARPSKKRKKGQFR